MSKVLCAVCGQDLSKLASISPPVRCLWCGSTARMVEKVESSVRQDGVMRAGVMGASALMPPAKLYSLAVSGVLATQGALEVRIAKDGAAMTEVATVTVRQAVGTWAWLGRVADIAAVAGIPAIADWYSERFGPWSHAIIGKLHEVIDSVMRVWHDLCR